MGSENTGVKSLISIEANNQNTIINYNHCGIHYHIDSRPKSTESGNKLGKKEKTFWHQNQRYETSCENQRSQSDTKNPDGQNKSPNNRYEHLKSNRLRMMPNKDCSVKREDSLIPSKPTDEHSETDRSVINLNDNRILSSRNEKQDQNSEKNE